ncbi:HsdM family class I SAM-dependent methyltransferase [Nocardia otitidiscaviarum]|uniref:HsdM family class I SAM-dependent methyltransferase n=1 Tax=Nocardia otitidiscaviarum TaxID=1823 RepID=UPI0018961942|nr:class I SAM-dependent DNA methyltransferase [Nocardia otitidiscaviarum]MBF6183323.1 SAM-dependent DNA methyltransferase [Nocardia otitidiscaviarum]
MSNTDLVQKLFKAASVLRGAVTPADYVDIIGVVLTLRWASHRPDVLEVPKQAQWNEIVARVNSSPREALETAARALVSDNREILDITFLDIISKSQLSDGAAQQLIYILDDIPLGSEDTDQGYDVAGRVYDQIIDALTDRSRRAEFLTPRSVAQLMVRLADPQPLQSIYDPCMGSGSLLIAANAYVADHSGKQREAFCYGQDVNLRACVIARMNLAMHGIIDAAIQPGDAIMNPAYLDSVGGLQRFDRVVTQPPFSLNIQQAHPTHPAWFSYGWTKKADLLFVQHVLASLAPDGVGVVVVPNGVLFRGGSEGHIRRAIVQDGRVAAVVALAPGLFNSTSVPASLLILRGHSTAQGSESGVLFIDAEREFETQRSAYRLAPRHVEKIASAFRARAEIDQFSRLVSIEEIEANDFNLSVSLYIDRQRTQPGVSISALLVGGVPVEEVDAQRDRFAALGIDLPSLLVPGAPGYFDFPPRGCEATAVTIPKATESSESAFATAVSDWFQGFRQGLDALTGQPLDMARSQFVRSFVDSLAPRAILGVDQLEGLFIDWWEENFDQLRRNDGSIGLPDGAMRVLDRIGTDLIARAKRLVAEERNRLVDTYLAWGDRYMISFRQLESQRAQMSSRLAGHLMKLGYQWPTSETDRRLTR